MNSSSTQFLNEFTEATELVCMFGMKHKTLEEFVHEYGDYYHAAALDGHEGSIPHDLSEYLAEAIELHARVQGILDRAYDPQGGSLDEKWNVEGRITGSRAETELRSLSRRYDLVGILRRLREVGRQP